MGNETADRAAVTQLQMAMAILKDMLDRDDWELSDLAAFCRDILQLTDKIPPNFSGGVQKLLQQAIFEAVIRR